VQTAFALGQYAEAYRECPPRFAGHGMGRSIIPQLNNERVAILPPWKPEPITPNVLIRESAHDTQTKNLIERFRGLLTNGLRSGPALATAKTTSPVESRSPHSFSGIYGMIQNET
jgi:hypothetical protein